MRKKGVFFTFIALFIVILIVAAILTKDKYRYREKSSALSSRIRTMNSFISDFDKDLERELFIGGYRSIISMNTYVREKQGFIPDVDQIFAEILMNGTANGTEMVLMRQESQGADIRSWLIRVNEEASKLNINIDIIMNDIKLEQTSPWFINVVFNATANITDSKNIASWHFTKKYSKEVPISGFEDPLYIIETSDKVSNVINITENQDFVNDTTLDASTLSYHAENSFYISSPNAPSYLMRFSGNLSPSPFGIESIVNPEDLNMQSIPIKQRSLLDYIYFGNQTTNDYCNVTGMPSWFRIDDSSAPLYEVNKLNKSSC